MGTTLWSGPMAGALAQPKPRGAYRVTLRRQQELTAFIAL